MKSSIFVEIDGLLITMVLSNGTGIPAYKDLTAEESRKYPISFDAFYLVKAKDVYYFPKWYKIRKLPIEYKWEAPYNRGSIKYKSERNIFSIEHQIKFLESKIEVDNFATFKKNALEIQKYKTSVSNIIFERKVILTCCSYGHEKHEFVKSSFHN